MYWIKKKEKKISLQRIFLCFGINSPFVKNEIVEREKLEKLSLSNKFWRLVYLVWTKILSREIGMFPRSPFLDPSFLTPIPQRKIKNKKIEKKGVPRRIPFRKFLQFAASILFRWSEKNRSKRRSPRAMFFTARNRFDSCRARSSCHLSVITEQICN